MLCCWQVAPDHTDIGPVHPRFKHPVGINLPFRLPSYLPVYCLILHQLFKPLLHCSLEDARLVSLLPKLSSESGLSRVQLQKHYKVWLWQSHIRLHAPVQAEALKKTKTSICHARLHVAIPNWWMEFEKQNKCTYRLGAGESNSRESVPVYNQSDALLQLLLYYRPVG